MKKRSIQGIAIWLIILVLTLPVSMAQSANPFFQENFEQQLDAVEGEIDRRLNEPPTGQDIIGEDIIVNIGEYQPQPIRASLIEDQGAVVYALLEGTPTNPTITVPRIRHLAVRPSSIRTIPEGLPVRVGGIRHINPADADLSYDNLGTLMIPIARIPREDDVPEEIVIDLDARITFDVSEAIGFGPVVDVLEEEDYSVWLPKRTEHTYSTTFIRASKVDKDSATFTVYDQNLNELVSDITVGVGKKSQSIRRSQNRFFRNAAFDRFTIQVDKIKARSHKVLLLVEKDGALSSTKVSEGEPIYPGSHWSVEKIAQEGNDIRVQLRSKKGKVSLEGKNTKQVTLDEGGPNVFEETFVEITGTEAGINNGALVADQIPQFFSSLGTFKMKYANSKTKDVLKDVAIPLDELSGTRTSIHNILIYLRQAINEQLTNSAHIARIGSLHHVNFAITSPTNEISFEALPGKGTPIATHTWVHGAYHKSIEPFMLGKKNIEDTNKTDPDHPILLNYQEIISWLENFAEKNNLASLAPDAKKPLIASLFVIRNYYTQELEKLQLSGTKATINEINIYIVDRVKEVDELLTLLSDGASDELLTLSTQIPGESEEAFLLAIQEYQKIVEEFSGIVHEDYGDGKVPVDYVAQKKIAELYHFRLHDSLNALQAYNKLLDLLGTYSGKERDAAEGYFPPVLTKRLISVLGDPNSAFTGTPERLDEGNGETSSVIIAGYVPVATNEHSTATLELKDISTVTVREGEFAISEKTIPGTSFAWLVREISDDQVILEREKDDGTVVTETIKRGEWKIVKLWDNFVRAVTFGPEKIDVRLIDTDLQREVHILVSPNTESAFSDAHFTLHLLIEKSIIDVPLFSETLEGEIVRTEELLYRLDEVLLKVEKIHNYWKQFCFVVFGFIWAKNILSGVFGSNKALARERTSESMRDMYNDPNDPLNCAGKTFDECVFQNQDTYNQILSQTDDALDGISDGKHLETPEGKALTTSFGDDAELYEEDLKDMYFYQQLEDDAHAQQQYYTLRSQLEKQAFNRHFDESYVQDGLVDWDNLVKENEDGVRSFITQSEQLKVGAPASPTATEMTDILKKQGKLEQRNYAAQIKHGLSSSNMESYFDDAGKETASNPDVHAFVQSLESQYVQGTGTKKQPLYQGNVLTLSPTDRKKWNVPSAYNYYTYTSSGSRVFLPTNNPGDDIKSHDGTSFDIVSTIDEYESFKGEHEALVSFFESGKSEGLLRSGSIDAKYYFEVEYGTGSRVEEIYIFERENPNDPLGSGFGYASLDSAQLQTDKLNNNYLKGKLDRVRACVSKANKQQGSRERGDVGVLDCEGLGDYSVGTHVNQDERSCTDIYSPGDCRLLFNACDPVLCPSSRCNLGGNWEVDNVVETGIIGSVVLCAPNIGNPTLMPICITGVYAGLQNIRSILQAYVECLKVKQVEGVSIGICDKLKSYHICEMLWKEGIAILSIKSGLLGLLSDKLFDQGKGGGEYASFRNSVDQSVEGLKFFTQQYAKNTFAQFSGGALPEIGAEVCKSAIYGKVPGLGSFTDRIMQPESPPQFTALLDVAPYTDATGQVQNQYQIFYRLYAGANEPVTYSVYLRSGGVTGGTLPTVPITPQRQLPRGEVVAETIDRVLVEGYNEICMVYESPTYGHQERCGFGEVSSSFGLNYILDGFAAHEASKQINTAGQCVPDGSGLLSSQSGVLGNTGRVALGSFSSGFLDTGIMRECSRGNPGAGGSEDKWTVVGDCWEESNEEGRHLGFCWLYIPSAEQAIKDQQRASDFKETISEVTQEVVDDAARAGNPIFGYLSEKEIKDAMGKAKQLQLNKSWLEAVEVLKEVVISSGYNLRVNIDAQMKIAELYEAWGRSLLPPIITVGTPAILPPSGTPPVGTPPAPPVGTPTSTECILEEVYGSKNGQNALNGNTVSVSQGYAPYIVLKAAGDDCSGVRPHVLYEVTDLSTTLTSSYSRFNVPSSAFAKKGSAYYGKFLMDKIASGGKPGDQYKVEIQRVRVNDTATPVQQFFNEFFVNVVK